VTKLSRGEGSKEKTFKVSIFYHDFVPLLLSHLLKNFSSH
jgi:hypothetical protein